MDMTEEDRISRLAKLIDSDIRKDQPLRLTEIEVVGLRHKGAMELHSICADFVASLNRQLSPPVLELSPPEYSAEMFRNPGVNLIQVNAQAESSRLRSKPLGRSFPQRNSGFPISSKASACL